MDDKDINQNPNDDTYQQNDDLSENDESTENNDLAEKDDFVIGEGFNIEEPTYDIKPNKNSNKHSSGKSTLKNIIWIFCIVIVSVGLAFGIIYAGADYMGIGFGRGENCTIEIDRGTSTKEIANKLKECGAVKIPILFRTYTKIKHYDSKFKYGVYTFDNESGYEALSTMLMTEGAKAQSVYVTIPEMSSVDDIAKILEDKGVCTKSDFIDEVQHGKFNYDFIDQIPFEKVYYRLEGYLFPDSYNFYNYDSKECAHLAVDRMLKTLNDKLTSDLKSKITSSGYTMNEIMTMASIVELECGSNPDEMSNVAAVFYNRLKSDDYSTLGSSPTRKYPYGNGKYNTYISKGLPPGPLCSPSFNSIKASISPTQKFDYYFFVTDAKMKFYYNKTLAQHDSTIAKLKAEKNWIYEE